MRKRVILDALKSMWLVILLYVISDTAIGYIEVYTAGITGSFADAVLSQNRVSAVNDIYKLLIAIGISAVIIPLLNFCDNALMLKQALKHDIVIYKHFFDKDYKETLKYNIGNIAYRLENDSIELRWKLMQIPNVFMTIIVMSISLGYAVFKISISYALVCIGMGVLPIGVTAITSRLEAKYKLQQKEYEGAKYNLEMDLCRNFNFIKLFCLSDIIVDGISKLFNKHYKQTIVKSVNTSSLVNFINSLLQFSADITVLIYGCILLSKNKITAGQIAAMFGYLTAIKTIISHINSLINECAQLPQCVERVAEFYKFPEMSGNMPLKMPKNIVFDEVTFSYVENEPVLKNINFEITTGQVIAVIGSNGKGKSTLMKLLAGLYTNYDGSIKVNGHELCNISRTDWINNIAYAEQEPYLFKTTVEQNIRLGNLSADDKSVEEVIKSAGLSKLKDTVVEFGAKNLSGGEKQRVSIARALLKNANILILDEPYNNLDVQGRDFIKNILSKRNKIIIYISHDKELLQYADKILNI